MAYERVVDERDSSQCPQGNISDGERKRKRPNDCDLGSILNLRDKEFLLSHEAKGTTRCESNKNTNKMLIIRHSAAFVRITVSFKRLPGLHWEITLFKSLAVSLVSFFLLQEQPYLYLEFISPVYILSEQMFHLTSESCTHQQSVTILNRLPLIGVLKSPTSETGY